MSPDVSAQATWQVPDGYVAIPIAADQLQAPLRLCAVVAREPDPAAGHLVTLRELLDARVLLGCLTDAGGQVHRWLELWFQDPDRLADVPALIEAELTNLAVDRRFTTQYEALRRAEPDGVIATGAEGRHPLPVFLDVEAGQPVHPAEPGTASPWQLCTDDAVLEECNLPRYSTSLARYLHLPGKTDAASFIPVTQRSPAPEGGLALGDLLGGRDLLPLNPGAGLMIVRELAPMGFETFLDLLAGQSWPGLRHGRRTLHLGTATRMMATDRDLSLPADGRLFLGTHGRRGRLVESYHLRLCALAGAIEAISQQVAATQRPLLNLTPASLAVRLPPPSRGLPYLWAVRTRLVDPGHVVELDIAGAQESYAMPARPLGPSSYRPDAISAAAEGHGSLRIRRVVPAAGDATSLEGTFFTDQRLPVAGHDMVWFRLPVGTSRLDFYARAETETALAHGEWRFRTIARALDPTQVAHLEAAAGPSIADVPFKVIPMLGTPCDLFSFAVLCTRALLVGEQHPLPVALDEMLSLARHAADSHDEKRPLSTRIRELLEADSRWSESLGPHRLSHEPIEPTEAWDLVPPELWSDTLAMIVGAFPGIGPDSICPDLATCPRGGAHTVFDATRHELDQLLLRTRSLIVIDFTYNREVRNAIRDLTLSLDEHVEAANAPLR